MASFEFLAIILTGLGLTVSILYYTRAQKHDSPGLFNKIEEYFREEFREALITINSIAAYFNGVGILVGKGMIDIELVDELLFYVIIGQWDRIAPVIYEMRRIENIPKIHTNFETLYKEIKKRNPT